MAKPSRDNRRARDRTHDSGTATINVIADQVRGAGEKDSCRDEARKKERPIQSGRPGRKQGVKCDNSAKIAIIALEDIALSGKLKIYDKHHIVEPWFESVIVPLFEAILKKPGSKPCALCRLPLPLNPNCVAVTVVPRGATNLIDFVCADCFARGVAEVAAALVERRAGEA